jgi:hypothetical protein
VDRLRPRSRPRARRTGIVVAQFELVTSAQRALDDLARLAERGVVLPARSTTFGAVVESLGIEREQMRDLAAVLDRDAIEVIARVPVGESAVEALQILWRRGAANLGYLPLSSGRRTIRSSPNDQSAKASISTST